MRIITDQIVIITFLEIHDFFNQVGLPLSIKNSWLPKWRFTVIANQAHMIAFKEIHDFNKQSLMIAYMEIHDYYKQNHHDCLYGDSWLL